MTNDERYGQVYGAALGRAMDELWEWLEEQTAEVPPSLDTAFSYVERIRRVWPEPGEAFRHAAFAACGGDAYEVMGFADELVAGGHFVLAERVARALDHVNPAERGIHLAHIRARKGERVEGLMELVQIARDETRTQFARLLALVCLGDLRAHDVALETGVAMLTSVDASERRFIQGVAGALEEAFFEPNQRPLELDMAPPVDGAALRH